MKRAWSIVLVIVFIAILLGAIAIGVGYLTGADLEQVYLTLSESRVAVFIQSLMGYWDEGYAYVQQFIADFPNQFAGIF